MSKLDSTWSYTHFFHYKNCYVIKFKHFIQTQFTSNWTLFCTIQAYGGNCAYNLKSALRHMFSQFEKTLLITPKIVLHSVLLPLIMKCVQFMNFHTFFFLFYFLHSGLRHVKLDCYSLVTNELLIALR